MLSAIFTHYGSVKQSVCVCSCDDGGKNVICKKWNLSALSGIFEHFFLGISEKKVSGNFFRLRGAVERKSKKKKKIFMDVFPCGFPICGIKKGGKSK